MAQVARVLRAPVHLGRGGRNAAKQCAHGVCKGVRAVRYGAELMIESISSTVDAKVYKWSGAKERELEAMRYITDGNESDRTSEMTPKSP